MFSFADILVIIGMFVLRIGVPAAVIAGLAYFLKRIDRKWEEEARAQQAAERPIDRVAEQMALRKAERQAAAKPAAINVPARQVPYDPVRLQQPGLVEAAGQPCWLGKDCPPARYEQCPAYQHPEQACWQARLQAEGKIPDQCPTCEIFQRYPLN